MLLRDVEHHDKALSHGRSNNGRHSHTTQLRLNREHVINYGYVALRFNTDDWTTTTRVLNCLNMVQTPPLRSRNP